jgi:hypothetical protein
MRFRATFFCPSSEGRRRNRRGLSPVDATFTSPPEHRVCGFLDDLVPFVESPAPSTTKCSDAKLKRSIAASIRPLDARQVPPLRAVDPLGVPQAVAGTRQVSEKPWLRRPRPALNRLR